MFNADKPHPGDDSLTPEMIQKVNTITKDFYESGGADEIKELFGGEDSLLETLLYVIYSEALEAGDLIPTAYTEKIPCDFTCEKAQHTDTKAEHEVPVVMGTALTMRNLMFVAMSVGIHWQKMEGKEVKKLEDLWGIN